MTTTTANQQWETSTDGRSLKRGKWRLEHDAARGNPELGGEWVVIYGELVQANISGDVSQPPFAVVEKLAAKVGV